MTVLYEIAHFINKSHKNTIQEEFLYFYAFIVTQMSFLRAFLQNKLVTHVLAIKFQSHLVHKTRSLLYHKHRYQSESKCIREQKNIRNVESVYTFPHILSEYSHFFLIVFLIHILSQHSSKHHHFIFSLSSSSPFLFQEQEDVSSSLAFLHNHFLDRTAIFSYGVFGHFSESLI